MAMNYLRLLFLLLIVEQTVLFAQKDSIIKKGFKPYSLIDAAPVAISKDDFKPQINITIQAVDALTNLPLDVKFDYYTFGDSIISTQNGKIVSLAINRNEKIVIAMNATGYLWQTQIFDTPESDTSYILKFTRLKKGDSITKHTKDFNLPDYKYESNFQHYLFGLQEFLKLNSSVKIQIVAYPELKEKVYSLLIKNSVKKRVRFKSCRNQKDTNFGTIIIKILSL